MPLREVLLDGSPDDPPDIPARPVSVLRRLNDQADAALRWSRYDELLPLLPTLIGELEVQAATADGADREDALRLLIPATATAVITLRYAAQPDLAWVAAERGKQAATLLGDPVWQAAAAYGMAHARSSTNKPRRSYGDAADGRQVRASSGTVAPCQRDLRHAALVSGPCPRGRRRPRRRGRTWCRGGTGRSPARRRVGCVGAIRRLQRGVWRTSLAVEAGNAERALDYASLVEPRALASNNRRGALAMERGRALAMQGKTAQAVAAFRQAEAMSPAQVLNNPLCASW